MRIVLPINESQAALSASHKLYSRALMFMIVLMGWSDLVDAGCPPLVHTKSFFENPAQHTPESRPLTDRELLDLLKQGKIVVPPLRVTPSRGPAPLTVDLHWTRYPAETVREVEIDFDGDGKYEFLVPKFPPNGGPIEDGRQKHTYINEGIFPLTMRTRDLEGQKNIYKLEVTVVSQAQFDAELQRLWKEFKITLDEHRDVAAALECIHSSERSSYQKSLAEILTKEKPIDQILTDISLVELRGAGAEYQMLRMDNGKRISHFVQFAIDQDGVWRIKFF